MKLCSYHPDDAEALLSLFGETVRRVNLGDYTQVQIEAWAPDRPDRARWQEKLSRETGVVAECDGVVVGFCTWGMAGYLDLLYVHHAYQRRGIAKALYAEAEKTIRSAGLDRIHTQASIAAQSFFLRQGFRLVKHQFVNVRGVD
jgi:putative acetyltransferase